MQTGKTARLLWHADKIFFGAALVLCAAAVASFWTGGTREPDRPEAPTAFELGMGFPPMFLDAVRPDPSVDIATDPDEYRPGPGEHVCISPECTYILPDGTKWCPVCGTVQDDRDGDLMDDAFEECHKATNPDVPDGHLDYDGDNFTNLEEYVAGSNPDDPNSIPAPVRLVGVGQELVDVMFRGFYQRTDGSRAIQLNWGNDTRTKILELDSTFRGYYLLRVAERRVTKGAPERGIPLHQVTEYDLILKRPSGDELVLPLNTPVREPERYGIFASADTPARKARAYAGQTFELDGHSYIVVEVSPQSAHLIGDRHEHHYLELRPERPR
jgi:hypothetical protein